MKRLLYVMTLATLAACGGGTGDTAPATSQPQDACIPKVVHIQMFGDSTAVGVGMFVQSALDAKYGVGAVLLEDRGVGGSYSLQLAQGTDGLNHAWPQDVTAPITTMNYGLNDELYVLDRDYRAVLEWMAPTLFITPNRTTVDNRPPELTEHEAQIMREVSAKLGRPVADVNAFTKAYPGWDALLVDGTHPSSTGYDIIARQVIVPAMAPLVDPMRCR